MKYFRLPLVAIACVVAASGQAVVESTILTGAGAGGAASGTRSTGSAVADVFGRLSEIMSKSGAASGKGATLEKSTAPVKQSASNAAVVTAVAANKPFVPEPIDASLVTTGLSREGLIACCGEPSMRTTATRKSKFVETMWYPTIDKDELKVQLEEGVVTLVVSRRTTRANRQ